MDKVICPQCKYVSEAGTIRCPRCNKILLTQCSGNCSKCKEHRTCEVKA